MLSEPCCRTEMCRRIDTKSFEGGLLESWEVKRTPFCKKRGSVSRKPRCPQRASFSLSFRSWKIRTREPLSRQALDPHFPGSILDYTILFHNLP